MRKKIISKIYKNKVLLYLFHRLAGHSSFNIQKKSNNRLNTTTSNIYKSVIYVQGSGNEIFIDKNCIFSESKIRVRGNNNKIVIGKDSFINGTFINIEGHGCEVRLGEEFFIVDKARINAVDGTKFIAGKGCMFSDNIEIRTSDSHTILDNHTKQRINYEEDVVLDERVWLGTGVTLLKGCRIGKESIVGAASVVTKKFDDSHNVIIVGNPAKIVKTDINWLMERI